MIVVRSPTPAFEYLRALVEELENPTAIDCLTRARQQRTSSPGWQPQIFRSPLMSVNPHEP
jgi:hypothetical protein